jgi:hypothetical protein
MSKNVKMPKLNLEEIHELSSDNPTLGYDYLCENEKELREEYGKEMVNELFYHNEDCEDNWYLWQLDNERESGYNS